MNSCSGANPEPLSIYSMVKFNEQTNEAKNYHIYSYFFILQDYFNNRLPPYELAQPVWSASEGSAVGVPT